MSPDVRPVVGGREAQRLATLAVHSGQEPDPATGATIPPIHMTTTFTQTSVAGRPVYEYSRTGNPTRAALETCLASLEGGEYGLAFASGSAATTAVLSLLQPGDRVVAADDLYGGTYRLFSQVFAKLGIEFVYVDGRDPDAFRQGGDARLFWIETPTNPLLHVIDIAAVASIAHERRALLAVDSTFATPCFQRPLTLGADLVVHSTTKYLSGHSDAVGGAVVTNDEDVFDRLRFYQNAAGAVPGPFEAWLTLRGLKTLPLRMSQHERNARQVATFLEGHPLAEAVVYPGLAGYPQEELASRQMSGAGGMVTIRLAGGRAQANAFVRALRLFSFAESLGGVESLVCHPATMTHASYPEEERARRGITDATLRLSVGIEDACDLVADLSRALEAVTESLDERGEGR